MEENVPVHLTDIGICLSKCLSLPAAWQTVGYCCWHLSDGFHSQLSAPQVGSKVGSHNRNPTLPPLVFPLALRPEPNAPAARRGRKGPLRFRCGLGIGENPKGRTFLHFSELAPKFSGGNYTKPSNRWLNKRTVVGPFPTSAKSPAQFTLLQSGISSCYLICSNTIIT